MFGIHSLSPSALHSTSKLDCDLLSSDTTHGILRLVARFNGDLVRQSNGQQPRPAPLANCGSLNCVHMSFITQSGVIAQADLIIGKAPRGSFLWLSVIRTCSQIQLETSQALPNLIETDASLIIIAVGAVRNRNRNHGTRVRVDFYSEDRLTSLSAK